MDPDPYAPPAVTVVVITRDRRSSLLRTLGRLTDEGGTPAVAGADAGGRARPPVIVVDNGSADGTTEAVATAHPAVAVIGLPDNLGAAGRNVGVSEATTRYVAFADDDSWWAPGALDRAAAVLDAHPRLALVAARVLVGPEERLDPTCAAMATSPLGDGDDGPGPSVLGFLACGSVVRRDAFLAVGGFERRLGVGGEEELLALDLAAAGWDLAYVGCVVAHHHPAPARDVEGRRRRQTRNSLWVAWLRLPVDLAGRESVRVARSAVGTSGGRRGIVDAVAGWRWVRQGRAVVPPDVAARRRRL